MVGLSPGLDLTARGLYSTRRSDMRLLSGGILATSVSSRTPFSGPHESCLRRVIRPSPDENTCQKGGKGEVCGLEQEPNIADGAMSANITPFSLYQQLSTAASWLVLTIELN